VQNKITRSWAVSFVVAFAMAYSLHRPARGGGGFGGLGGGGFGGFGGSMGTTYSRLWPPPRRRQTILHRPVALWYWMTHDAADNDAVDEHVEIVVVPLAGRAAC
jgi:hypothetical protein